ncbi:glutamate receptor ionotropic, kainate 2-like isoform X2 [Varroa jacobsoni]|uniref:glutamate receptor ionotropic, kainate 2-like isoform X2 n=1 Tax=Varroa jacobsoni TaxID=62625 RepID=UPI000BF35D0F|nr:glutamate receptor ionotropic, kainate 2-like isoform X2 [Varroa jacobsoni]
MSSFAASLAATIDPVRSQLLLSLASLSILLSALHRSQAIDHVNIGGIFDQEDEGLANHFTLAVDRVNRDLGMLGATKFQAKMFRVTPKDSFGASKRVCELARHKVAAFVGPSSPSVKELVKATAFRLNVPHVSTSWELHERQSPYTLRMYPEADLLARAYRDIISEKKWKKFAIFYDSDDVLVMLKYVLADGFNQTAPDVLLYEFDPDLSYEKMLKDIGTRNHFNVIIGLRPDRVKEALLAAEGSYSSFYHSYLILGLDFHSYKMEEVVMQRYLANVTMFRLVDPSRSEFQEVNNRQRSNSQLPTDSSIFGHVDAPNVWAPPSTTPPDDLDVERLTTEEALMYDAVSLIANGVHNLLRMNILGFQQLDCNKTNSNWDYGQLFLDHMKELTIRGLTGDVRLDKEGKRDMFTLDVLELNKGSKQWSFLKKSSWDPTTGINKPEGDEAVHDVEFSVSGMILKVVTVENAPYTIINHSLTGQDRFYGYAIDLIKMLAEKANFTPEFYIAPDSAYGSHIGGGVWNGMIGDLMKHKADIAIVDLTTTAERESVVDFTTPFMNTGISILLRTPEMQPPSLFSFLHPFSPLVWFYTLTVYILITVAVYVLGRFTPYEWVPSHPCDPDSEPENQFGTISDCFWFTMGSIMQQGSDLVPRAVSTRTLASLWYFFCLILISSYTANLAAFLTAARMSSPIENANDLAKQTDIAYGAKDGGSTKRFFQNSNNTVYKRMWAYMESQKPSVFPKTNEEGIQRVLKGDYAYLMEVTSIDYLVERNCNLTKIGGLLDNKGYGIATPQGSQVRGILEHHLIIMQEKGVLQELKDLWWKIPGEPCDRVKDDSAEMSMESLGGVFYTLYGGVLIGVFVALIEFWWEKSQAPYGERDHILVEFLRELKLVLTCTGSRPNPESADNSIADDAASRRSGHSRQASQVFATLNT